MVFPMPSTSRTLWGGIVDHGHRATGFFRIAQVDGVWWLIDPAGGRFLSKGIDTVTARQDRIQNSDRIPYAEACRRKYHTVKAWRAAAAARLSACGVNTLGAWSDKAVANAGPLPLAITPVLHLANRYLSQKSARSIPNQMFPDVFDRRFKAFAGMQAQKLCAPHRDDPNVIGWFSDNELRWTSDWRGWHELLPTFLRLPAKCPGRQAAIAWLQNRYGKFDAFNSVWRTGGRDWMDLDAIAPDAPFIRDPPYLHNKEQGAAADERCIAFFADCDAFAGVVAERYFMVTVGAIKAADPNHLALGCRFAYPPAYAAIVAAGRHLDVISFNCYDDDPSRTIAAYARELKPCLIGEFSFRATDSGLPNTNGAGRCVTTQRERAQCYLNYVTAAFGHRSVIGCHWFEHADQPAEGRFDGENSNFGIVTIDDDIYEELTHRMAAFNSIAEEIHGRQPQSHATAAADTHQSAATREALLS